MSTPAWLKPVEVARQLRVSPQTIYRWTSKGNRRGIRLVCVRTGVYGTRYRADWVERFMRGEQVPIAETKPETRTRRT